MLIPRVMKGLEKSITFSLSEVMVKPATARSAFYRGRERERRVEEGEEELILETANIFSYKCHLNMTCRTEGDERKTSFIRFFYHYSVYFF